MAGLGFSAFAHSEVIRKFSTPLDHGRGHRHGAELARAGRTVAALRHQGAAKDYWLPRLADGREIPCFGLTSPEAGSDAAAMTDTGVVCRGTSEQQNEARHQAQLAQALHHARAGRDRARPRIQALRSRITIGEREDIGITVALVPTDLPGVEIGRRHLPAYQVFQNGPNCGRDVFIPIDNVIGGVERRWARAGRC